MYEISGFLPGIADILAPLSTIERPNTKEQYESAMLDALDKGALAGRRGLIHDDVNTYPPGTEAYVQFKKGYMQGQAAIAGGLAKGAGKPRGRPKGWRKNKPTEVQPLEEQFAVREAGGETELPGEC